MTAKLEVGRHIFHDARKEHTRSGGQSSLTLELHLHIFSSGVSQYGKHADDQWSVDQ
jgi:hypothetical protein